MRNGNSIVDVTNPKRVTKAASVVHAMTQGAMKQGYNYSTENSQMSYELRLIEAEDALIDAIRQRRLMRRTMRT
jgi:hypothetical protein